jgi:hypothetical protein
MIVATSKLPDCTAIGKVRAGLAVLELPDVCCNAVAPVVGADGAGAGVDVGLGGAVSVAVAVGTAVTVAVGVGTEVDVGAAVVVGFAVGFPGAFPFA